MGFNRLPASGEPSLLPKPTTVCSSSINKIICPSEAVTSRRTALRRSSNSPRNFAPAISAPISNAINRRFCSEVGTSLLAIRKANPSAMAVFPTPGSPISTGLFFLRRLRTWMVRRISSSRPITGSIFPWRALSTKS